MRETAGASQPSPLAEVIRFGSFEVDTRSGELRRGGVRIRLNGQPFDVLVTLLEKPGEVVTREELHAKLWSEETFVDFEHGLNKAVNKLRNALGDNADNPRFIETLPRRGYRFLAPVTSAEKPSAPAEISTEPTVATGSRVRRRRLLYPILVALVLLAAFAWLFRPVLPPPAVSDYTQLTHDGKGKYLIGTDGPRLYFARAGANPAQMSVDGGDQVPLNINLPGSKLYQLAGISPDGSKLLIAQMADFGWTQATLWSVPTLGGSPIRLANTRGIAGAWSPDGQKLAYVNGRDLYLANADGTGSRLLTRLPGPLAGPNSASSEGQNVLTTLVWSPDGHEIAMTLVTPKELINQIWAVSSDGRNLHRMFSSWRPQTAVCCGSWTPDGKYFIFDSQHQIWAARRADSFLHKVNRQPVQLTSGVFDSMFPIPGRDGKSIFAVEAIRRGELQRYNLREKQFEDVLGGISAQDVAFSKDREWAAYVTFPDGILWRSRADGSEKLQLSSPPIYAENPRWSPDGTKIVYFALEKGHPARIYEVSALGGPAQQISPNDTADLSDPNWSPDGNRLVFGSASPGKMAIQVLDLKTHRVSMVPGSDGLFSPRWSPNGQYLLALTDNENGLKLFNFKTSQWTTLYQGMVSYPAWSHDSKFVYFLQVEPDPAVNRIALSSGKMEQVVDLKGFPFTGFYTFWFALAPDDSPLLLKYSGTEEIISMKWTAP